MLLCSKFGPNLITFDKWPKLQHPTLTLATPKNATSRWNFQFFLFASGVILLMLHSKRVSSKNMRWPKLEQFSEKCSNFGHQIVIANISKSYRPMQFLFSRSDKESFQLPNKYWIKLKRLITSYGQFF